MDSYTRDLALGQLVDCGVATDDTSRVDGCAVDNHQRGQLFRAFYPTEPGDLEGPVRVRGGDYVWVRTGSAGKVIEQADCQRGEVVTQDGREFVDCISPGEFSIVCE